jgi:hypothetical protein
MKVCYVCEPERKAEAERRMLAAFQGAARADEDGIVAIGTDHGPLPLGAALRAAKEGR